MNTKIVTMVVGIFVAITLVAGLVIPAIAMADDAVTTDYKQPTASIPMTLDENGASYSNTITFSKADMEYTIGDKTYAIPNYTAIAVMTDQFVAYTASNGEIFVNFWNDALQKGISYQGAKAATLTIADGVASLSFILADNTESTATMEQISWIAYRDNDGKYAASYFATYTTEYVYYENINQIRAVNYIQTTNGWFSMVGDKVLVNNTDEISIDNTATADSNGVYKAAISRTAGSITFDVDNNGADYTVHPWIWLIPQDFTIENNGMKGTLGITAAIPFVLIAAILVGVAAIAFRSKME